MTSPLKAWVRALERTAPIGRDPSLILPVLIEKLADQFESAPALVGRRTGLSYRALAQNVNQYARWGRSLGLGSGDVVGLLMPNSPEYMAVWLGLTRIGVAVALLNTNLSGELLAHAVRVVAPGHLLAGSSLCEAVRSARPHLSPTVQCWVHGASDSDLPRLDVAISAMASDRLEISEYPLPSLGDRALYIYTSGTTGLPKAANVSNYRIMQWSHWFAGMMDTSPNDRMYDCLPMYHSVGGVVATGATLVGGGAVILRERFSAREFWRDIVEERCTLFQYIGELCRYLLATPPQPEETAHELRLCCGNGLRGDVWTEFQSRFGIPQILEYYAATEGSFSLYNCEGRPGAIGRIPPFLSHRMPVALVELDAATDEPSRDMEGWCRRCAPNETGEAIGQIADGNGAAPGHFEGYADPQASEKKILRNVFAREDAWYRTGDLMRQDEQGFFYFVDRVGDTFRWKGENVSTTQVASVLSSCRGVVDVVVYGVSVPNADGRAGMAAIVVDGHFELQTLWRHVVAALPAYARPLFLRIVPVIDRTDTFKLKKAKLAAQAFGRAGNDEIYLADTESQAFVKLDAVLHERIRAGTIKL